MNPFLAFGFGGPEMIFVFLLLLLLFGAKKLPGLARGIGQSLGEFKKARQEFDEEVQMASEIRDDVSLKPKKKSLDVSTAPKSEQAVPAAESTEVEPEPEPVGAKDNKSTVE